MHHYQRRLSCREPLDRYDEEEEEDREHCETFRRSRLAEYVNISPTAVLTKEQMNMAKAYHHTVIPSKASQLV